MMNIDKLRNLFLAFIFLSLIGSCVNNEKVTAAYLILRGENKEIFEKNNKLLDSLNVLIHELEISVEKNEKLLQQKLTDKDSREEEIIWTTIEPEQSDSKKNHEMIILK